ncbi:MAG: PIN domain-containing protein [Leptospirales bacterium]
MIGLDTNVLVRYLAQDDPFQSPLATSLIEETLTKDHPGFISLIALTEVVWVLESCYRTPKGVLVDILERILAVKQFAVQDSDVVWHAVRAFKSGKADFADCLIERGGKAAGCSCTMTFDMEASRGTGMHLLT